MTDQPDAPRGPEPDDELHLISTGIDQHVDTHRMRALDEPMVREYEYATKSGQHLWIAACSFKINPEDLTTGQIHFDAEGMLGTPGIGCYVCEEAYEPRLAKRRCAGEPMVQAASRG